tara:strand:- start:207 stop:494 length:288 start_codon:yes stop_codon:yes gene_type:complete
MNPLNLLILISFFGGFLTSSIIDTSLGEFNEWAIVGAALVIASIESFNNFYYLAITKRRNGFIKNWHANRLLNIINYFKIGIIYGLIVDGFKLGS